MRATRVFQALFFAGAAQICGCGGAGPDATVAAAQKSGKAPFMIVKVDPLPPSVAGMQGKTMAFDIHVDASQLPPENELDLPLDPRIMAVRGTNSNDRELADPRAFVGMLTNASPRMFKVLEEAKAIHFKCYYGLGQSCFRALLDKSEIGQGLSGTLYVAVTTGPQLKKTPFDKWSEHTLTAKGIGFYKFGLAPVKFRAEKGIANALEGQGYSMFRLLTRELPNDTSHQVGGGNSLSQVTKAFSEGEDADGFRLGFAESLARRVTPL